MTDSPAADALFVVRLTCCERDDGSWGPNTWKRCDEFRDSYLNGEGVSSPGGHRRSAIIEAATRIPEGAKP